MMTTMWGLLLGLLSGVMTGSFSLPMKRTTRWSWEATWLVWSFCALLIIPWAIAFVTVPNVLDIFNNAELTDIFGVFVFGLCWGLGAVFFGQSISMIGVSLSFALCIGLATALGALIPMLKEPQVFLTAGGVVVNGRDCCHGPRSCDICDCWTLQKKATESIRNQASDFFSRVLC